MHTAAQGNAHLLKFDHSQKLRDTLQCLEVFVRAEHSFRTQLMVPYFVCDACQLLYGIAVYRSTDSDSMVAIVSSIGWAMVALALATTNREKPSPVSKLPWDGIDFIFKHELCKWPGLFCDCISFELWILPRVFGSVPIFVHQEVVR